MTYERTWMHSKRQRFRGILWGPMLLAVGVMLSASPSHAQEVDIHGFFSQGYLKSTGNNYLNQSKNGDWEFTEIGLNFGTSLTDDLRYGMQFYARQLGDLGGMKLEYDWAFLDYTWESWLSLRAGRFKNPYGLYGEYQDLDLTRPSVILPQSVYFLGIRDILVNMNGLQIYGNIDYFEDWGLGNFDYQIAVGAVMGTPVDDTESSVAGFFENRGYDEFNDRYAVDVTGIDTDDEICLSLQWNTPWEEFTDYDYGSLLLRWTSLYASNVKVFGQMNDELYGELQDIGVVGENFLPYLEYTVDYIWFWVGSLEYTYENTIFSAEYTRYYGIFESNLHPIVPHSALNQEAFYFQLSYRLSDFMQVAAYYSLQFDPQDRGGEDPTVYSQDLTDNKEPFYKAWMKDASVSLRFDINDYWLVKLEGHFIDGTARVYESENRDNPYMERYWTLFGAKTTLTF